jgi:Sec-independent protein secretion pathway component TatC
MSTEEMEDHIASVVTALWMIVLTFVVLTVAVFMFAQDVWRHIDKLESSIQSPKQAGPSTTGSQGGK